MTSQRSTMRISCALPVAHTWRRIQTPCLCVRISDSSFAARPGSQLRIAPRTHKPSRSFSARCEHDGSARASVQDASRSTRRLLEPSHPGGGFTRGTDPTRIRTAGVVDGYGRGEAARAPAGARESPACCGCRSSPRLCAAALEYLWAWRSASSRCMASCFCCRAICARSLAFIAGVADVGRACLAGSLLPVLTADGTVAGDGLWVAEDDAPLADCADGIDRRPWATMGLAERGLSGNCQTRPLLLRRNVLSSGPLGTVSCGCHFFGDLLRGAAHDSTLPTDCCRSRARDCGVGGALRLNSFGIVILVELCTLPVIARRLGASAWRHETSFFFICSRIIFCFSRICCSCNSSVLSLRLTQLFCDPRESRESALCTEYVVQSAVAISSTAAARSGVGGK